MVDGEKGMLGGSPGSQVSATLPLLPRPVEPVHVHVIAPHLVSWGIQRLVQCAGAPFWLVGASASIAEAMQPLARQMPDVVVLDLDDGYEAADVRSLCAQLRVKLLVLTSSSDPAFGRAMLDCGARGVLHKRSPPSALLKAIERVADGAQVLAAAAQVTPAAGGTQVLATPPQDADAPAGNGAADATADEAARIAQLTARERQTIAALAADAAGPLKVVADRLCISEHTLRNHLTSIYAKLGVAGRLGLYAFATRHGLDTPPARRGGPR